MRKQLLRLLRIAPLALMFASVAFAQTTGTIIGVVTDASTNKPVAGALIIATSPNLQGEQTAVTDNAGNFRITQLPPGAYKLSVQLEGFNPAERSDINVRVDKTLRANLAVVPSAVQMEEQVVRTGVAPVINVGTAESGTVVSKEFIATMPVGRGFENIAVIAPTAKNDTYGVSFAGAQSPENQYIVDGLNTTDPVFGNLNARNGPPSLRSNFLQELDVKTGNFGAEYGRATGGIMNVILKGGSNEFHGSVFSSFTPSMWFEPDGQVQGAAGQAIGYFTKPGEGSYALDYGFEVGGPIMKDRLWFYGGFAPVMTKTYYERFLRRNVLEADAGGCPAGYAANGSGQCVNDAGEFAQTRLPTGSSTLSTDRTTYQWVGKLTYLLTSDHNLTVTGWGAPSSRTGLGSGFTGGAMYNSESTRLVDTDDSQMAFLGRWGGKFLARKLLADLQVGWYATDNKPAPTNRGGIDQGSTAKIEWRTPLPLTYFETAEGCTDAVDCPVNGYQTGGYGGLFDWTTERWAGKASLSYLFSVVGLHNVKGGVDLERVDYEITKTASGGTYWQYRTNAAGARFLAFRQYGKIAGDPDPVTHLVSTNDPAQITSSLTSNKSRTESFAYYLQDSWQLVPSLTLNYGVRLETQRMRNLTFSESAGMDIKDNWAPRVQAIWDFTGNGRGKVAASWGRFYWALPLDMGDRTYGGETQVSYNLLASSCGLTDIATQAATFDPNRIGAVGTSCTVVPRAPISGTPVGAYVMAGGAVGTATDPDLKGQYVDQFGGQIEYEILPDLSLGIEYQGRRQGDVIEDLSTDNGITYFIGNPGRARTFANPSDPTIILNTRDAEVTDIVTGRTLTVQFKEPERSYDGVTFKVTKNFSKNWLASAAYTLSSLRGNYAGPYRPEDGQFDPGITSEFDLPQLMANKNGYLPGDQRHLIKLFGAYNWVFTPKFNVTTSVAYNGASGYPISALGAAGYTDPPYGDSQSFIIPRGQGGRTPFSNTFDVGAAIQYVFRAPYALSFRVDAFNVLNRETLLEADNDYTFDDVLPMTGVSCTSKNAANSANPIQALQNDCPDLAYLKTVDGRAVTPNVNWGKASRNTLTPFQLPFSLRLSAAFSF